MNSGAGPATGLYDLRFGLYDAASAGTQQGILLTNSATAVSNGLFAVTLDFGNQFPGANRWLEIGVRTNGSGAFTTLAPREAVTPTPYAIYATSAGSAATASTATSATSAATATTASSFSGSLAGNVTGTQGATVVTTVGGQTAANVAAGASAANAATSANTPNTIVKRDGSGGFLAGAITAASFAGSGSGLTNLNATQLTGGTLADARLSTNVALLNAVQNFTGSNNFFAALVATNGNSRFAGNGGGLTNLNTTNLIGTIPSASLTGTIPVAQLPPSVVTNGASGVSITGTFTGNGAGVTNVNLAINSGGAIQPLGGFGLASSPGVGGNPQTVIAVDVNGDGNPDLISANAGSGTLTVLTNNGSGVYVLASAPGVGSGPESVVAADVNGDGKPDLISANSSGNTLSVLTNTGGGNFLLSSSPTVGSKPYSVTAADVNGDGKLDLISANFGIGTGNTLTVLTNNGIGGFVLSSSPVVGSGAVSVAAADVNGDGKVDLISANFNPGTFSILTNNGSGGFVLSSSPSAGSHPYFVAAADVNGDGKVDLISANNNFVGTLTVLTNIGSGGFVLASSPSVGSGPVAVAVADVNGDGKPDLISANANDNALSVLLNVGGGSFALSSSPGVGSSPSSVAAADVNGDGKMDLISANAFDDTLSVLLNSSIFNGTFFGIGTGLTSLNAAELTGIVPSAQISGNYFNNVNFSSSGNSFSGDGSGLTGLNASELTFGTVNDVRLSSNVALRSGGNTLSGSQVISGNVSIGSGTVFTRVQDGIFTAGTNGVGTKVFTNTFPVAFSSVPTVTATPVAQSGTDLPEVYSITVRRVTTTNFVVNIFRVDTSGAAWSQSLRVAYHAWE